MSRRTRRPSPVILLGCLAAASGCAGRRGAEREPLEAEAAAFASPKSVPAGEPGDDDGPGAILISRDGWVRPGPGNPHPPEWVLAEEVLARIRAKDSSGLNALRLSAREYAYLVYPEVEGDMRNRDFFFTLNDLHSRKGIGAAIGRHGDEDLELLQVIPTQGVEECSSFTMLNWVELLVRDRTTDQEKAIQVIGGIVIKDGAAKAQNFRD